MASGSAKMNGVGDQEVHELEVINASFEKIAELGYHENTVYCTILQCHLSECLNGGY